MSFTLIGNTSGMLSRKVGNTRRGEPLYGEPVSVRVDVIHLTKGDAKTSVRTDSSASRGNAEEEVASAKILFQVSARPVPGDRFVIDGVPLEIVGVEPRRDVFGKLDHYEAVLTLYAIDDEV
jgi:hypothetical protein